MSEPENAPGTGPPAASPLPPDRVRPAEADPAAAFFEQLIRRTPTARATYALVVINVALFVAMSIGGAGIFRPSTESLLDWGADYGPWTVGGEWWRLLTAAFVHVGALHLILNMWALYSSGLLVERLFGTTGFVILYAASGIAGSLASIAWNPLIVSAGASGAIFGVLGAMLGILLRQRRSFPHGIFRSLRGSGMAFVGYNTLFGLAVKGIDLAAHFGGLAAGFLCGLALAVPLTDEGAARRPRRNAVVALAAAAALSLAASLLPRGPAEFVNAVDAFREAQRAVLADYNAAADRWNGRSIDGPGMVELLRTKVLAPWREARARIEAAGPLPESLEKRRQVLLRYMALREEAWGILEDGLLGGDAAKFREATRRSDEAEKILGDVERVFGE